MKVKLLPLAVTAAIAMPGLALADGPTVYGKMNLSVENVEIDDGTESSDNWQVISNSSRLGFKGDAKINSMLKATYLAEWGVSGDGDGTDLSERNRSVGLAGNFGALDIGKFDTPLKVSQGKVDQFNDLSGDLQNVLVGENRADDIIQYTTPDMSGLQARLAVMPGEEFDNGDDLDAEDDVNENGEIDDGPADAMSASVAYTNKMIYAALAQDVDVAGYDTTRLTGQFTTGPVSLGAIYQMAESSVEDSDEEQDGYLLSAAYSLGQTVLKAQYAASTTEFGEGVPEVDTEQFGLGVDQKLSAQTVVFAYVNMLTEEEEGAEEESKDNLGVGIVHSF